jgi:RNA polymerase sigma factor (sigma-70 family)
MIGASTKPNARLSAEQSRLVEDNQGIAITLLNRMRPWADHDAAADVAFDALINAALCYDPARGVKFGTYAWSAIRFELCRAVRRMRRVAIPTEPLLLARGMPYRDEPIEHREERQVVRKAVARLGGVSRMVISRRMDGDTLQDIANSLGCTRMHVCNLQRRAVAEIRRLIGIDEVVA